MKISFVIPAYNEEKSIGNCIGSVQKEVARASADAEIIVVNNASTDRTEEAARSYSGVTVVNEPHKGIVRARQAGFVASCGELIANIDADTIVPPGWLSTVLQEFESDRGLAALSGPYIYYDLSAFQRALVKVFYAFGYLFHFINQNILGAGAMLQGGNFVLRRSSLEAVGGYDTSIEFYGEDTDIARRISKVGRVKWTFKLPMRTSGRRLKNEGVIRTGYIYAMNFFWTTYLKKPLSTKYTDVR